MKNWNTTLVTAEYNTLREEILKRVETRYQLLSLSVTALAALLAFGSETKNATLILLYPVLALCLAISWLSNSHDIWNLSDYIMDIEDKVGPENLHWEGYRNSAEKMTRAAKLLSVGSKGIFVITELLALLIGIIVAITQPQFNNVTVVITCGCFSVVSTITTIILLIFYRRPEIKRLTRHLT